MQSAICPVGGQPALMCRIATTARLGKSTLRLTGLTQRNNVLFKHALDANAQRKTAVKAHSERVIVCSAAPLADNPFKYPRPMDGLQSALSQLPSVGVYVLGAALVAVLGGAGVAGAGAVAPESFKTAGKAVAGLVGAAVGGFITLKLQEKRQSAAIIELSNLLVEMGDPTKLTREQVEAVEAKYGAPLVTSCLEDVKSLYGTFVEAIIPAGSAPLRGDEQVYIKKFKAALGLSDVDAAPMHIEVGRRVLRGRMESSSRGEDFEARKTFQKLIYVSSLVFGRQQSQFLLPWVRVFGLNEAQVKVAYRDNARALFSQRVAATGLRADRATLAELKAYMEDVRLDDDEATSVIVEAEQKVLEAAMDRAIECIKRRTRVRDFSDAISAVREAVDYNRAMAAFKGDAEVPAGVGPASLAGTAWEGADGRSKDLREVFRVYLEECLARDGAFTDALEADAADLRTIIGLGPKEAAGIENEVKEKAYRKLLREEVTSGRLDAAASKAEVLGELVDRMRWDSDAALELHRNLYRQKLSSLLEKKALTEEDSAELSRLQRLLCVPNDSRDAMHAELCGGIFREAVSTALAAGIDGFGFDDRKAVQRAFEDLRLSRTTAREILDDVARKYLLQFISSSRNTRDRISAAKELKKMVFFSNILLAPLVDDLKTDEERQKEAEAEAQQREIAELMAKAKEEAEKEKAAEAAEGAETKAEGAEEEGAEAKAEADTEAEPAAAEAAAESTAEEKEEEKEDAEVKPKSLEKAQTAAAARAGGERVGDGGSVMKSQKDITLAKDLDLRDRVDIYRNFLLYCMTGDVMQGPMGVQMVTERDESEFARLSQLGDVLGLTQMDVYQVHQGLAEQAYKSQVQQYMGDGMLTPERTASLEAIREKMGLPKEAADKIIKGFQNQKLIDSMQAAKAQGNLTLDRILELKDAGVEPASLVSGDMLQQMYRQEISTRLTDGTGDFDADRLLHKLPADLGLDASKAERVVKELAKERKRLTLVQAVSSLRQKKMADAVKSLNNLKACAAALPDSPTEAWGEKEEVADLYSLYCSKESDDSRRAGVQAVLGISDDEAATLRGIVEAGQFKLGQEAEEEEAAFF